MKKELAVIVVFFAVLLVLGIMTNAYAWTPLIQASDFLGIQSDVLTTATGIISVVLIVLAVGIIVKVFT